MEHGTEFHGNTNYIIMWCVNDAPITQTRDKFTTITEEKDLQEFTIAINHWSCINCIQLPKFQ